jgi:hypothetical protein
MWILKNSKELLENLKSPFFSQIYSIKTYDFTTLYTTIPHGNLKTRLFNLIDVTITMHLSLYIYLNFPRLGIIPIILCNKAQPAKTWSAGSVTDRALKHDRRGQNASEVVELAGKGYGKLPCLLNTDNGTEEGLW